MRKRARRCHIDSNNKRTNKVFLSLHVLWIILTLNGNAIMADLSIFNDTHGYNRKIIKLQYNGQISGLVTCLMLP